MRLIFRPKSQIQTFFPPKIRWSPKKIKKVFAEIESDFSAEIPNSNVFSAQNQVVSEKKKKRSSPQLRQIFRPKSEIQKFEGGLFSYGGGLLSIFRKKSPSKAPKTYDFAYFTSQWGARAPPAPPGYATASGSLKMLASWAFFIVEDRRKTRRKVGQFGTMTFFAFFSFFLRPRENSEKSRPIWRDDLFF